MDAINTTTDTSTNGRGDKNTMRAAIYKYIKALTGEEERWIRAANVHVLLSGKRDYEEYFV